MSTSPSPLRLGLPKGRMQEGVLALCAEAGIQIHVGGRGYRPKVSLDNVEAKLLKPQNIIEMLHQGSRDIGFAGADWVGELGVELVSLLDLGLDPVRLVVAAPAALLEAGKLPKRPLVVASEYERLTRGWIATSGLEATFVRSYGATEVFPPEDADVIVDNTATGSTLDANQLVIMDEILRSSTQLYANPRVLDDPAHRAQVEDLVLVLGSVLEARRRVMVEVNVSRDKLAELVKLIPCMREPTISSLHGEAGYAVKAAVPRSELPRIIPLLKAQGGTDIVVTRIAQLVS
jgi:ATP phosphoribosyltransferase